jgi:preprotein translocase subunit SecY
MFKSIIDTFGNCFKIPELKSRIIFTCLVLMICRVISIIPIPGLDGPALFDYLQKSAEKSGSLLGMYSMFTGGAFEQCAVGSLGIMPYISATIIIQLLSAVVPTLSKLAREEGGRAKIVQYGRYLTVILCLGQAFVLALGWEHPEKIFSGFSGQLVLNPGWWYLFQTTMILTTGTMLLMWLGEQITDRGIGNGVSLIITINILARAPKALQSAWEMYHSPTGESTGTIWQAIFLIGLMVVVVASVIAVTQAQRKIPVQYAQRMVGRKTYQGGSSFMPLKVNYAGVMPIIFAQAILMFPSKILYWGGNLWNIKFLSDVGRTIEFGRPGYVIFESTLILFFSYFWVATQFNELQIADDLKKYGGYIPGVRPGTATSDFLHRVMSRITLAGAIFLTIIAVIPTILNQQFNVPFAVGQFFGGTSMLISVGVMLDTVRMMESHLLMRHYDGFLKGGKGPRMRGR